MRVLSNLKLHGSHLTLDEVSDFPTSPGNGQMVFVSGVVYIYTTISGVSTWYPVNSKSSSFVHIQGVASTSWVIKHNLNTTDFVFFAYDSNGDLMQGDYVPVDNNTFNLDFTVARYGKAVVFVASAGYVPAIGGGSGTGWDYNNKDTDPSISINPTNTGATWKNKVTGEIFICTDNTADNNVWVGQLGDTIKKTDTPIVTIAKSVNENSTVQGTYTSEVGSTVNITASKGTISNISRNAKTFLYTAYDITDGKNNTDTITANATKPGQVISSNNITNITVIYVPITADGIISNADFKTNVQENKGWTY